MKPSHFASLAFRALCAAVLFALASCTATPLPDPPSLHAEMLRIEEMQPGMVTLTGLDGAFTPAPATLRVTDAFSPAAPMTVTTTATGAFAVTFPGSRTDWLYVELVMAPDNLFLAAVTGGPVSPAVAEELHPVDFDMDRTPDALDCAPSDIAVHADCDTIACSVDSDCPVGMSCLRAMCLTMRDPTGCPFPTPETCNGIDDDCDGLVDDGCVP